MERGTHQSELASTSSFEFGLAGDADDAELCELLRATPLGGSIQITLRREPRFFDSACVEGPFQQVLIVRDTRLDQIVGMGTRSVRMRFVDGEPTPVGYLGGLRLRPEVRGGSLLARGYRELRRLHADGRAEFYLTTITSGNEPAMNTLATGRKCLPMYFPVGRYYSFVLPARPARRKFKLDAQASASGNRLWGRHSCLPQSTLGRQECLPHVTGQCRLSLRESTSYRGAKGDNLAVRPLEEHELPQLVAFLNDQGQQRLFFPCLTTDDFLGTEPTFRDLPCNQIMTAWRDNELVGVLAAWDQSRLRQIVVEQYRGVWRYARPIYNFVARRWGGPQFPSPGDPLRHLTLALPLVADGNNEVFRALLTAVQATPLARQQECLMLGMFERDPLLPIARRLALHSYVTQLFVVGWHADAFRPERFLGRDLYLELGCL